MGNGFRENTSERGERTGRDPLVKVRHITDHATVCARYHNGRAYIQPRNR
jgi:hypothetical protein